MNKIRQQFWEWAASLSFGKKILIMLLLPLVIELLLLLLFLRVYIGWSEADKWVMHSQAIHSKAVVFQRSLLEARAQARSFALFGGDDYIKRMREKMDAYKNDYYQLKSLVSDNEKQIQSLENLEKDILSFDTYLSLIRFEANSGREYNDYSELLIVTKDGERLLDQLFDKLDTFIQAELSLDKERKNEQKRRVSEAATVIFAGGAVLLVITIFIGFLYQFAVKRRFNELIKGVQDYADGRPFEKKLSGRDEIAQLEQVFFTMAKSLKERSMENEAFIYSVSHDMRSPLVNLHGFSDELQASTREIETINSNPALTDSDRKRLDEIIARELPKSTRYITSAVSRLSTIIDGLLKLSRIGRIEYEWKVFDPNLIMDKLIMTLDKSLRAKGAVIKSDVLPELFSDPAAFEQIFANLLVNAVNYLDPEKPGIIHIGIAATESDDSVTIYVKDNGLGFPESFKKKIFLPFQRYHSSNTQGEGIGLALVQRLVEKINAKIWVDSEINAGTTFFVMFPAAIPRESAFELPDLH